MKNRPERARRLQHARLNQGLKQSDAAQALNRSIATIKGWESATGSEPATLDDVVRVCALYQISIDYYVTGEECAGTTLSREQSALLSNYAALDPELRQIIQGLLARIRKPPA